MNLPQGSSPQAVGPNSANHGIGGVLGQYTNLPQLAGALQAYFLPSSSSLAPSASNTGNRTVTMTNQTVQATLTSFTAGVATWSFSSSFNVAPVVGALPIGPPPSSGTTIYAVAPGPSTMNVAIKSTDATDARQVMIWAIGNPN